MPKLRIVSHSDEPFRDRREAGRLLSYELEDYHGQQTVVLGIPRGGVIVAHELARALEADLDIVLARKLRSPGYEELALGAMTENGQVFLNEAVVRELHIADSYIEQEKTRQLAEIASRTQLIRKVRPKVPLKGRLVIVTDDGVATGATAQAALWAIRQEQPKKLMAAFPVGSGETVTRLAHDVDELVCLRAPPYFSAVGQFYIRFDQVGDEEVLDILRQEPVGKTAQ